MKLLAISALVLVLGGPPSWLFTLDGCRQLSEDAITEFDQSMTEDPKIGPCVPQDYEGGRVFRCQHGAYLYFYDQDKCEAAVKDYRDRHLKPS